MATMQANVASKSASISLTAGQRIVIQILNPDGSVAQAICDDAVPSASTFAGATYYSGTISPA